MKKLFAIIAIAGILVACGNKGDKKADTAEDSVNKMVDSATMMIEKATDSATKMINDSTNKMLDSVK